MKAEFVTEDHIVLRPESNEEQILFNRFVKLLASNQKRLAESPTMTDGKYTALGLSLMDKEVK